MPRPFHAVAHAFRTWRELRHDMEKKVRWHCIPLATLRKVQWRFEAILATGADRIAFGLVSLFASRPSFTGVITLLMIL